jgi:signal transduction histidine kinase
MVRRLAHNLHDEVLQQLVALQFQMVHLRNLTKTPTDEHLEQMQILTGNVGSDMGAIVRLLRVLISDLRPPGLEAFGLKQALESYLLQIHHTWPDPAPTLELVFPDTKIEVPLTVATVLLRAAQEALHNVHQYALANHVKVELEYQATHIGLIVQDDGAGFESPERLADLAQQGHFGLLGIAEKVDLIGGTLTVESKPQAGTTLRIQIPL